LRRVVEIDGINRPVSAVLFDLDDTLLDRRGAFDRWAQASAARWLGRTANAEQITRAVEFLHLLDNDGFLPRELLFEAVQSRFGRTESVDELIAAYYRDILSIIEPMDGAVAVLQELVRRNIPFGLVTNGNYHQTDKAALLGLPARAACMLISSEFGTAKPARAIFREAARQLGLAPAEIAFVGDQPAVDVVGASLSGMIAIWLHSDTAQSQRPPSDLMDLEISSMRDLVFK
jgi:putative hydrolase of the HAD superfamily